MFDTENFYPTYMRNNFVDERHRSLIRINLACNYKIIAEAVCRMAKVIDSYRNIANAVTRMAIEIQNKK